MTLTPDDKTLIAYCANAIESLRDCEFWYNPYDYDDDDGIETYDLYQEELRLIIVALRADTFDLDEIGDRIDYVNDAMVQDIWQDHDNLSEDEQQSMDDVFLVAERAVNVLRLLTGYTKEVSPSLMANSCHYLRRQYNIHPEATSHSVKP